MSVVPQRQFGLGAPQKAPHRASAAALAGFVVLLSSYAYAADYHVPLNEPLRGSQAPSFAPATYPRWEGFYFGGHLGETFGNVNFGNASAPQISYILSNSELQDIVSTWTTLLQVKSSSPSFGAFIGYNVQWDDVITGIELNYSHLALNMSAVDSLGPLIVNGANQRRDERARFGWAYDRLLPYAFVGPAFGLVESSVITNVNVTKSVTPPPDSSGTITPGPFLPVSLPRNPQVDAKSQVAFGFTAGLGLDLCVTDNLFLRTEWEYVGFPNINGFRAQINTVRAGVGLKF